MGKGNRNRQRRREAPDPGALLDRLFDIEERDFFLALVEEEPEILGEEVRTRLSQMAATPPGLDFRPWQRLLRAARRDPSAAWEVFSREMARYTEIAEKLVAVIEEALEAERNHDSTRAIKLAEKAIPEALEAENAPLAAALEAVRAKGFLTLTDGNRADNLDEAIAGYDRSLHLTADPEEAARTLMHMAIAVAQRSRDDPAENLEWALDLLNRALEILPSAASDQIRTTIQTNMASLLVRREQGGKVTNLKQAVEICEEVLRYRSLEREPSDWAYIQLNYAPALEQLADHGEVDRSEAIATYAEVIAAGDLVEDQQLANAHFQLGRTLRREANFDPEEFVEDWDSGEHDEATEAEKNRRLLEDAREHLEQALELHDAGRDPLSAGWIGVEHAHVLGMLDEHEKAIEAARKALPLLPPSSDPREARRVAQQLGNLLALDGKWAEAAAAFRIAVEAAELAFHSRLDTENREREADATLNLTRWAAFAIAAAGEAPEAMMVLESGRSRDMRQRLGLGEAAAAELEALPAELRDPYLEALAELAVAPLGDAGAAANRRLQEALREIRAVSGYEQFATRAHPADLIGALEPDWPLLYVDPTPYGTMLLLVEANGDGATVDARFLDEPKSLDVLRRLLAGNAAGSEELLEQIDFGSYLSGASGFGGAERDIQKDVEQVLPWIGESFAKPIHELLAEVGARGVTLITCGPVGLAPLHAAPWQEDTVSRCLVDDFEIRHTPSAAFAAASLARANERADLEPSLVGLADPLGDLPAAVPEIEAIAQRFAGREIRVAGGDATWEFLRAHAREGTHLHLACHSRSAVWGESLPAVILADGPVAVSELTELAELPSRLVAVSACQSGVVDITHLPEEAISAGSVLLAAGAACVIASLWPVRDDTTALLMARMYEEIIENGRRPPEALRRSQLWLRQLTDGEAADYLRRHPELEQEFRRRAEIDDRPGQRLGETRRGAGGGEEHPYSEPDYWAPFIALGA